MTDLETLARSVAATIKAHCDRRKGSNATGTTNSWKKMTNLATTI